MCNKVAVQSLLEAASDAAGLELSAQQISTVICIFQSVMAAVGAYQATFSLCMGETKPPPPADYNPGSRPRC